MYKILVTTAVISVNMGGKSVAVHTLAIEFESAEAAIRAKEMTDRAYEGDDIKRTCSLLF